VTGIEPYRYANGDVLGADPADDPWADPSKTPSPAAEASPPRGRASNRLALRARRVRTDPNWASLSPETRRRLIDLDRRESRGLR
jgi:hypothetical protein